MPTLLIVETASSPTSRVAKQLRSAAQRGWRTKVILRSHVDDQVRDGSEEWETIGLPTELPHVFTALRQDRIDGLSAELLRNRDELNDQVERLRAESGVDETDAGALRDKIERLRSGRRNLAISKQILHEATRTPTPYGRPFQFGDPLRLEHYWYELASLLASLEWDVCQAADLDNLPPVVWASRVRKDACGIVFDAHELYPELAHVPDVHRAAWRDIARRFLPLTDAVVAVSDSMAREFEQRYGGPKPVVVRNCPSVVDGEATDLRARAGLSRTAPLAVHIGGVPPSRHPERLIEVVDAVPEIHLVCLGVREDSEAAQTLMEMAEQRRVRNRVHILPPVDHDLIVATIAAADLSLITHGPDDVNREVTLPNKLFESLAASVPVAVVEGTATSAYVVERGVGCSFRPGDLEAIASVVRRVIGDPTFRERAKVHAADSTWEAVEEVYLEVLDHARDQHPSTAEIPEP